MTWPNPQPNKRSTKPVNQDMTQEEIEEMYGAFESLYGGAGELAWFWFDTDWQEQGPYPSKEAAEADRIASGLFTLFDEPDYVPRQEPTDCCGRIPDDYQPSFD